MNYRSVLCSIVLTMVVAPPTQAADPPAAKTAVVASPVGRWKTVDDNTGKVKSVVVVKEEDGKVTGTIEKLLVAPGEDPNPKCDKCTGERKNQLVIGMKILWNLKKDKQEWSGGTILDPENGKTYKCYIAVIDGGKRLKVRGYLGITIFGRTQYWIKDEP